MVALHLKNCGISKQATAGTFPIFLTCPFLVFLSIYRPNGSTVMPCAELQFVFLWVHDLRAHKC
ncbi:hypothetical protein BDW60DRAFT_107400 [Aspergillus nidulans var. acristatus]